MTNEASNFLFGGGGKAAPFDEVGDEVKGTITDVVVNQQTDMETGAPLTWTDGSPRMQLVVSLQTGERADDNDDGIRRIYAKGGNYEVASGTGTSMKNAIADALKKVGATSIDEGGVLRVAYTGVGKKTNRGFSAPKLYRATYEAPKASVKAEDLFSEEPF
jgi:hypothetical protein